MAGNKINFTKAAIYGLPTPSKGIAIYRDSKERGLSLYITKNRVMTFFVRKRIRGVDKRFIVGNFPEVTVETARKATVNISGAVGEGIDPNEKKKQISKELRFEELFELYINKYAKKHKKSYKENINQYNRYLSKLKKRKISTMRKEDITKLHNFIAARHGLYVNNRALSLIQAMFNKGIEWGWEEPSTGD